MFCIGNVSPEHKKLVDVVKEGVELGLEQVKPWGFMGDMAEAVQKLSLIHILWKQICVKNRQKCGMCVYWKIGRRKGE